MENFEMILVESDKSEEVIYEREKYWITTLDTVKNGYNLSIGGRGNQSSVSDEQKDQMLKLYTQESLSLAKISDHIGLCITTIFKFLQDADVIIPHQKEFSDADVQKMTELRDAGYIPKRIGDMFGVSRQTIERTLSRIGIENPRAQKLLSQQEIAELIELRQKGARFQELERRFGIRFRKIKKILRESEADIAVSTKKIKASQLSEIMVLIKQGFKNYEIAAKYGVSGTTIGKMLKDAGEAVRPHHAICERNIYSTEQGIRVIISKGGVKLRKRCKTMDEAISVRDTFLNQFPEIQTSASRTNLKSPPTIIASQTPR